MRGKYLKSYDPATQKALIYLMPSQIYTFLLFRILSKGLNSICCFYSDYVADPGKLSNEVNDEGYSGSQEVSLENSGSQDDDSNFLSQYFTRQPNLNDISFHTMCQQVSGFPDTGQSLLFEDL